MMSNFVCFVKVMREVNVLRIPPSYLPYIFVELKLKNKKLFSRVGVFSPILTYRELGFHPGSSSPASL